MLTVKSILVVGQSIYYTNLQNLLIKEDAKPKQPHSLTVARDLPGSVARAGRRPEDLQHEGAPSVGIKKSTTPCFLQAWV